MTYFMCSKKCFIHTDLKIISTYLKKWLKQVFQQSSFQQNTVWVVFIFKFSIKINDCCKNECISNLCDLIDVCLYYIKQFLTPCD